MAISYQKSLWLAHERERAALGAAPRVGRDSKSRRISDVVGLIRKNPNRTSAFAKPAYRTGRATADGTGLRLILLPPTAAAQTLSRRRFGKTAKEPVKTIGSNFLVYPEFIEGVRQPQTFDDRKMRFYRVKS
ncbi:MAG: hypothetical protein AAB489_00180 [Patescibacteria group bacterium]